MDRLWLAGLGFRCPGKVLVREREKDWRTVEMSVTDHNDWLSCQLQTICLSQSSGGCLLRRQSNECLAFHPAGLHQSHIKPGVIGQRRCVCGGVAYTVLSLSSLQLT